MNTDVDLRNLTAQDIQQARERIGYAAIDIEYAKFIKIINVRRNGISRPSSYAYAIAWRRQGSQFYTVSECWIKHEDRYIDVSIGSGYDNCADFTTMEQAVVYADHIDHWGNLSWDDLLDIHKRSPTLLHEVVPTNAEQRAQIDFLINQAGGLP